MCCSLIPNYKKLLSLKKILYLWNYGIWFNKNDFQSKTFVVRSLDNVQRNVELVQPKAEHVYAQRKLVRTLLHSEAVQRANILN